jgi:predicted esterase
MSLVRSLRVAFWTSVVAAGLASGGCNLTLRPETPVPDGGADGGAPANGVGTSCTTDSMCRTGLTCSAMTHSCQPPGNRAAGASCTLSAECMAGQWCTFDGVCAARGTVDIGGKCTVEGECKAGICNYQGLSGTCAPAGAGDLGATCGAATDCMGGLICSLGQCRTIDSIQPWQGAVCPDDTMAPPRAVFHVPRMNEKSEDFYRLPFPNDIRKNNGKISLSGHPTPGARYLPFDPVQSYLTVAEEDLLGFGTNVGVFFRFTRPPTVESARAAGAVSLINVTPTSPDYGKEADILPVEVRTEKSNYVCSPYLIVHSKWGTPLRPGETYAAVIRRGLTDATGLPFDRDVDFPALLGNTVTATDLGSAWGAYAPLRAWMQDKHVDPGSLLAAAVFTTQKLEDPIVGLRQVVRDGAPPAIKGLVKCDVGVKSPCDDGKTGMDHTRGCVGSSANFDEYQGTIAIPVFQTGKKPYLTPADGGGIAFDPSTGKATPADSEDVCFTLTVPKGAAPPAGWPVVVYAHGTGGSYRSVVELGLSDEYAQGKLPQGPAAPMATFGYDGALHANRRGGSDKSPDDLFYNFVNARAARDNSLQAAADLFVIARALEAFTTPVALDPGKVMLYGHSQGGNAAALAVPYEPRFRTSVMSGTGGTLAFSLLTKKQPVDIASGVPLLLGDPKVDELHPILNILQMYFERSDAVNFGRRLFLDPPPGGKPQSVLHIYGTQDTYAPAQTQQTYALSARFPVVGPALDNFGLGQDPGPLMGNIAGGAATAAEAQFAPSGYDGHFVSTQNPAARALIQQMLGTAARDGLSTVGP